MPQQYRPRSRCSDQEITEAIAGSRTIAQVLRRLGLGVSGANYKFIHHTAARLSLATSHLFGCAQRPSDEEVAQAVADGRSLGQALQRLCLPFTGGNARFLRLAITRLCLDTTHWGRPRALLSDEQIAQAVSECTSIAQVLCRLGLSFSGSSYKFVHRSVARLELDTSHWLGEAHLRGKTHNWSPSIPLSEILVEKSTYTWTANLKRRLIREGLLQPCCQRCGISKWHGEPLALVLDHINGIYDDNRIENLRLLCPNCHSLTPTFAGRNIGRRRGALVP